MTVRLPGLENRRPLRVILDTDLRLPVRSRLVATAREFATLVICGPLASASAREALEAAGVQVQHCRVASEGRLDLMAALRLISERGLTRVFSEGGPSVAAGLIKAGLADDVVVFTAPRPLGREGLPALDEAARAILADTGRFRLIEDAPLAADRLRRYEGIA
jgi:diaminohydroxyphosphoribosylaminopyrimidine deaminase/5-amino-6-(5-phosphoribosylamino)uracil reductase